MVWAGGWCQEAVFGRCGLVAVVTCGLELDVRK